MSNNNTQSCCITAKDNFAILGLFFWCFPLVGLILSIIGLGAKGLKGIALIGFILSALCTAGIILLVIFMIVDPTIFESVLIAFGNILALFGVGGGL